MLLGVLTHVECDEGVLVTEEELGERLGQFGLADARGAGEDERAGRSLRVLESGPRAPNRLRQRLDGLLLTDDALVQLVLHAQQAGGVVLGELGHGDAGHEGDHLGDQLLVDLGHDVHVAGLPLPLALCLLGEQLLLPVAQRGSLLEVLLVDRGLLVATHIRDPLVELTQIRRCRHAADAQPRAGLVDEVDGLVGQLPIGDVAVRQARGCLQGTVGDRDPVVRLVAVAQALEDLHGVLDVGGRDLDRCEAALKRGVLLDVLAVLVQGRGTDGLQFATS